jgi:HEPN domain-containing protein
MMTKADYVAHWMATADDNWRELHNMVQAGDYLPALFWAHLCIEKLSKALWVKENVPNVPPRIHNITHLLGATTFQPTPAQLILISDLNRFQLEGRYPDYHQRMRQLATATYTQTALADVTALRQCLLNRLL